uniref:Conotoxin n=1 Tax=Conus andremenezi TaxID=1077466 RepID=A0A291C1U4_9COND|nr:conotoxin [Conus andremenezi]
MKTAQPHKMGVPFPALKTMVTVFLLLMGNTSPVHPVVLSSAISLSTVATIASGVISAGTSLAGVTLQGLAASGYRVTCTIQVENWTRYPLLYPSVRIANSGVLTTAPTAILPGKKEAFATRMPAHRAEGVYGTVSWEMHGTDRRFVLMWSAPFNFHFYSNWLGLGMTKEGVAGLARGNTWFDQMYYGGNSHDLTFEREEFKKRTDPVIYRNDKFEVVGIMTNIHRAQIKVIVRPTRNNWKDLADPIRLSLEQQQKRALQRDN